MTQITLTAEQWAYQLKHRPAAFIAEAQACPAVVFAADGSVRITVDDPAYQAIVARHHTGPVPALPSPYPLQGPAREARLASVLPVCRACEHFGGDDTEANRQYKGHFVRCPHCKSCGGKRVNVLIQKCPLDKFPSPLAPATPPGVAPRKLILDFPLSPGDVVMGTAAVRDLHRAHPGKFLTAVAGSALPLWQHNPYVTPLDPKAPDVETIRCEYPAISQSNQRPLHFLHGYTQFLEEKLGVKIPVTEFRGDVHLSAQEKSWKSQVAERGHDGLFWILMAGGKWDFTAKWWNPAWYQEVVNHFRGLIQFVQCGDKHHWHPKLSGVIDLVGQTDLRQFIRLMHHADGVVCPVTFAMHLAAAVPFRDGRGRRPCVVLAGGREPAHWEQYPGHQFLQTVGQLDCCAAGGCWKARAQRVGDGDAKDRDLCRQPVELPILFEHGSVREPLHLARCMEMIRPADVIRAIEGYYTGGILKYGGLRHGA